MTPMLKILMPALLLVTVQAATVSNAQAADPTKDAIVNALSGGQEDAVAGVRTRSLRPAAAEAATAAAEEPQAPAAPHSISLQIRFDFASDHIARQSASLMDTLTQALGSPSLQGQTFQIVGHTDGRGRADYNLALSRRRADAVKAYLVGHGIDAARLSASGKGMTELLNKDNPAAAENRRVEIVAQN
jgi:outer membrane protein OmpA-like peptidoglycan-associated protein